MNMIEQHDASAINSLLPQYADYPGAFAKRWHHHMDEATVIRHLLPGLDGVQHISSVEKPAQSFIRHTRMPPTNDFFALQIMHPLPTMTKLNYR